MKQTEYMRDKPDGDSAIEGVWRGQQARQRRLRLVASLFAGLLLAGMPVWLQLLLSQRVEWPPFIIGLQVFFAVAFLVALRLALRVRAST